MVSGRDWRVRIGRSYWKQSAILGALALSGCTNDAGTVSMGGSNAVGGPLMPAGSGIASVEEPPIGALATVGDVVGQFELAAPSVASFVLHGTLPVPRGTYVAENGTDPFVIVDAAGNVTQAQAASVTRYPDPADGSDVVEVIARVARPAEAAPGQMIRYDVRYQPHAAGSTLGTQAVQDLIAAERGVVLRTKDVFGNPYSADLFHDARSGGQSLRTLKNGSFAKQVATHQALMPDLVVAGPQATLKHQVGVHAYATLYEGDEFMSLDLRVHNAFSGLDDEFTDDDPLGKVYFESLELVVPAGWSVLTSAADPYFGTPYDEDGARVYPIVRAIDGGQMHVMPPLAQFERRLALVRDGHEAAALSCITHEGLGFARAGVNDDQREWFSWWNKNTGRWFSQRHVLPSLAPANEAAVRADLSGRFAALQNQIATGSVGEWPAENPNLGWAHPWGLTEGGMVSGSEIYLYDGIDVAWSASRDGYRRYELTHRMYTDRQPNVLFNRDGRHTQEHQWQTQTVQGPMLPVWWYNSPMFWASDPFGYNTAPTFQVDAVTAGARKPWYEDQLLAFHAIDLHHLTRYTRSPKVLLWLGNDALAKDDLCAQAEGFRISYTMLPQDIWGAIIPTGLYALRHYVDAHPGEGLPFGRGEGWGLDTALVAYSVQSDDWRERNLPWFREILDVVEKGQSNCSYVIQSTPLYNIFDAKYRCRQSIEAAITENALVGLRETVFLGSDSSRTVRLDAVLRKALYAMVSPLVWSSSNHGPWAMIATGPFNVSAPPYCNWVPSDGNYGIPDHYQIWSSFAYGWELTHDPIFLSKATEAMGATDFITGTQDFPLYNWQNRAALMALGQELAVQEP